MKQIDGLLRYDVMDTGAWCFDMGYQIIQAYSGMHLRIQLDGQFQTANLIERDDEVFVVWGKPRRNTQCAYVLKRCERYPAKMSADTVEAILNNAALAELESTLCSQPAKQELFDDDFYF